MNLFKLHMFSLLLIILGAGRGQSEVAAEAPEAGAWFKSLDKNQLRSIVAPMILTIVEAFKDNDVKSGTPKFLSFDHSQCRLVSFFDCASPEDANFSLVLNNGATVKGVTGVMALTGADSVIYQDNDSLYMTGNGGKAKVEIKSKIKDISKIAVKDLLESIVVSLGYDAVVLAVQDDYVLLGSTERRLQRNNLQGLAFSNSSQRWSIVGKERKGSSLLALVNRSGSYGVFQQVIASKGKDTLKPGTKVILESK